CGTGAGDLRNVYRAPRAVCAQRCYAVALSPHRGVQGRAEEADADQDAKRDDQDNNDVLDDRSASLVPQQPVTTLSSHNARSQHQPGQVPNTKAPACRPGTTVSFRAPCQSRAAVAGVGTNDVGSTRCTSCLATLHKLFGHAVQVAGATLASRAVK